MAECDVGVTGGDAPGCCEETGGGGGDYCSGLDVSGMATRFSPYEVGPMSECTEHPCFEPMCNPL